MKFLHLGDVHLGKTLNDYDLSRDQKYMLDQIIGIAEERSVDGILIAGDIYDKSVPSESATKLLDQFLNSLIEKGKKVFMISGNHDSDERLNYGSSVFRSKGVYIYAKYNGTLQKETLKDEYGEIDIWMLPFVKASQVRHFFPKEKIETYDAAVRTALSQADIDPQRRNIIISHQFVAGKSSDPDLSGSEGIGVKSVGTVEKVGYDCFDLFDYAALGHIHSPQSVGRYEVRYSGSPLKYSLSEVTNDKSVPLITMGPKGEIGVELIKLNPLRDMRHLKGPFEKITDKENISGTDDFIYVTLTDEDIIDDAMGIIQRIYPNTIKLDYENSRTNPVRRKIEAKKAKSPEELFGDFYRKMYGCEISDEEMQIIKEAAKEAGVIDETD